MIPSFYRYDIFTGLAIGLANSHKAYEARVLLVQVGFKVHRGMITERAVEAFAVVKDLHRFKSGGGTEARVATWL